MPDMPQEPNTYEPQRLQPESQAKRPPLWLMVVLALCVELLLVFAFTWLGDSQAAPVPPSVPSPVEEVMPSLVPTPAPTPTPTPEPTPEPYDWSQPVPEGEAVDQEDWFADAVFIGDSRVDGFHLYSGVTKEADFLDHTGLTVYEVVNGKEVIRQGEKKVSILAALDGKSYGKVYIALGVNELGYKDPQNYADVFGTLVDAVREKLPDAAIYVQAIIPVNTKKCKAYDQAYYVNNENVTAYNEVLAAMAAEKEVYFLSPPDGLLDEAGETSYDLSADGVHFKKDGYVVWLEYLTTHTGADS